MAAIYTPLWPAPDEIVTTTLYPVDTAENVQISITIVEGFLSPIPSSDFATTFSAANGSYTQLRWFYYDGPYDSEFETTFNATDGSYTQLRWFYYDGPYDSNFETTFIATNGSYDSKLIEAETEIDELQLDMVILASSSMTAV